METAIRENAYVLAKMIIEESEAEVNLSECKPFKRSHPSPSGSYVKKFSSSQEVTQFDGRKLMNERISNEHLNNYKDVNNNMDSVENMFLNIFKQVSNKDYSQFNQVQTKNTWFSQNNDEKIQFTKHTNSSESTVDISKQSLSQPILSTFLCENSCNNGSLVPLETNDIDSNSEDFTHIEHVPTIQDFAGVAEYESFLAKHDKIKIPSKIPSKVRGNLPTEKFYHRENVDYLLLPEMSEEICMSPFSPVPSIVGSLSSKKLDEDFNLVEKLLPLNKCDNFNVHNYCGDDKENHCKIKKKKKQVRFATPLFEVHEFDLDLLEEELDDTVLIDEDDIPVDPYSTMDYMQKVDGCVAMETDCEAVANDFDGEEIEESGMRRENNLSAHDKEISLCYGNFVTELHSMAVKSSPLFQNYSPDDTRDSVDTSPCIVKVSSHVTSSPELFDDETHKASPQKKKIKLDCSSSQEFNMSHFSKSLIDQANFVWYHSYITAFYHLSSLIIKQTRHVGIHEVSMDKGTAVDEVSIDKGTAVVESSSNIISNESCIHFDRSHQDFAVPDMFHNPHEENVYSMYDQGFLKPKSNVDEMMYELMLSQAVRNPNNPPFNSRHENKHNTHLQRLPHRQDHIVPEQVVGCQYQIVSNKVPVERFHREKNIRADDDEEDCVVPDIVASNMSPPDIAPSMVVRPNTMSSLSLDKISSYPLTTKLICNPQRVRVGLSKKSRTKTRLHPYR